MIKKSYTEAALMQFIRDGAVSGQVNPSTARSRKKAAEQLLTQLNVIERQDLRQLDVDDLCSRFHKLQGSTIRPESLEVYRNRLKGTLADFISWTDDPEAFTPGQKEHRVALRQSAGARAPTTEEKAKEELVLNLPHKPADIFPVPIREDLIVYIQNVPLDMTKKEAEKIVAVVRALADSDD